MTAYTDGTGFTYHLPMTRAELDRLARSARSGTAYRINPTRVDFPCPLDIERKRAAYDRSASHWFRVDTRYDATPSAAQVRDALARHLDPDSEECEHTRG